MTTYGAINIRPDFSVVELPANMSPTVLEKLRDTRISGRLIEIKPDRGPAGARRSGPREGGRDAGDRFERRDRDERPARDSRDEKPFRKPRHKELTPHRARFGLSRSARELRRDVDQRLGVRQQRPLFGGVR